MNLFNKTEDEKNESDIRNSLLPKHNQNLCYDPTHLIQNKKFQMGMKMLVFLFMMSGLIIGKMWMTVKKPKK